MTRVSVLTPRDGPSASFCFRGLDEATGYVFLNSRANIAVSGNSDTAAQQLIDDLQSGEDTIRLRIIGDYCGKQNEAGLPLKSSGRSL